jgi:hypothetical protein
VTRCIALAANPFRGSWPFLPDWTYDGDDKFFLQPPFDTSPKDCVLAGIPVDECQPTRIPFETGVDRHQASHWLDNQNVGAMDPTLATEERSGISGNDLAMFAALGWHLSSFARSTKPLGPNTGPLFDCSVLTTCASYGSVPEPRTGTLLMWVGLLQFARRRTEPGTSPTRSGCPPHRTASCA